MFKKKNIFLAQKLKKIRSFFRNLSKFHEKIVRKIFEIVLIRDSKPYNKFIICLNYVKILFNKK